MADKLALPLLLPYTPSSKPLLHDQNHHLSRTPFLTTSLSSPPPPPVEPLLHDVFLHQNPNSRQPISSQTPRNRNRTRIGKSRDPNLGRPWSYHGLSPKGQQVLRSLIEPTFDSGQLDALLSELFEPYKDKPESTSSELLAFLKGLGFHKKFDLALRAFDWFMKQKDYQSMLDNSVVAIVISMLGKEGRVSSAANLFNGLQEDGFSLDVYSYTSLISAFANSGRYREAVNVFKKMEEEGCKPTLITYNVILNVFGKMGTPWNKITSLVEKMKSDGIAPDAYTYNTLITCCKRGSLHQEAAQVFEEMKAAGFSHDKVTYNALLDVYGRSHRPKEAMKVLNEMELNGFSPSIVTYNSLISAYARDGMLDEAMELKNQMAEKGTKPDVFTYTTLLSGFERAGKVESAMNIFEEMRNAGCKPNICTFNAFIKMYGRESLLI